MNKKITLLTHESDLTSFSADWLQPIYEEYFNIELFDDKKTYDPKSCLVVCGIYEKYNWTDNLSNFKILHDTLYENVDNPGNSSNNIWLTNKNWAWYFESLWYLHLGYDLYCPQRNYKKTALMLIRRQQRHKDFLFRRLNSFLDDFIYSYVDKGIFIEGDIIENGDVFQRHFNPDWYNSTCFSMVVESHIRTDLVQLTEKTFKCFAHQHPFMIYGSPGSLTFLKNLGFETYENIFDESYDNIIDYRARLKFIIKNLTNFKKEKYNNLTLEKIEHNKNLFYNKNLIKQKIVDEIIFPILEYAET